MRNSLVPGVSHSLSLQVSDHRLMAAFAPHLSGFSGLPSVFATSFLVGFMELACTETIRPYLSDGENTVGSHVYLSHVALIPKGMNVTAHAELVEVRSYTLRFRVDCYDECGLIGSGFHERTVVDTARFTDKVRKTATTFLAA